MTRKFFHILLFLLTSTVVFGHAVVGHHHHEEITERGHRAHHHDHHGHHHHDDEEDSGLKHLFEHHAHFVDNYTDNTQSGKTVAQTMPVSESTAESQKTLFIAAPYVQRSIVQHYREPSISKLLHIVHLDFRGPPQQVA